MAANKLKILILDVETAPHLSHVWDLWQQDVSLNQLIMPGYMLCWAAKWLNDKEMFFCDSRNKKQMLIKLHSLMDEADVLLTYNGIKFDVPVINAEFVQANMKPPSPFKHIDLCNVVKSKFRFASSKLAFVSEVLNIGSKMKHEGHELWIKCMNNDNKARSRMEKYNKQDVLLLERAYLKILPWITNHPNVGLYIDTEKPVCPNCGSSKIQRRGFAYTTTNVYSRLRCSNCGKWARGRKSEKKNTNSLVGL